MTAGIPFVVDGHVHLYRCFERTRFFASAWRNLARGARACGLGASNWEGVLLFTESAKDDAFEALSASRDFGGWDVIPTAEPESLRLERAGGDRLTIVSGYQVATAENLEVLAIGTRERVPDRSAFSDTVRTVRDSGAAAVIPWGFGKWTLRRRRIVREALMQADPADFVLGDNGGRPDIAEPALLREGRERGFQVWPGTDPLPFPNAASRVGAYGFVLDDMPADDAPAAAIRARARSRAATPRRFGRGSNVFDFAVSQVRMQLRKRIP